MRKFRLGILGSGKGSNFQAILSAIQAGGIEAEVAIVLSDVESAGILNIAREARIPAWYIAELKWKTKLSPEVETSLVARLREADVDLVVLAGYMRMIKAPMLEAFPNRIINIHPSLLPAFPGLQAWKQALDAGATVSGCTVHYVDGGMDTGKIIEQKQVTVIQGDTPESLHARIQVAEHELYPSVVRRFAQGQLP